MPRATRIRHLVGAGAILLSLCSLYPTAVEAQYNQPGSTLDTRQTASREDLAQAVEDAPWHLGAIRVNPILDLHNVTYERTFLAGDDGRRRTGNQWIATAGAGLDLYLPLGEKTYLVGEALPSYTWLQRQRTESRLVGNYGLALEGFGNEIKYQIHGSRLETIDYASSELFVRLPQNLDRFGVNTEIHLYRSFYLFLAGDEGRWRFQSPDDPTLLGSASVRQLDRTQRIYRSELRFRTGEHWFFGVGAQRETTDFGVPEAGLTNLSSKGTSLVASAGLQGAKFRVDLDYVQRSLDPQAGSDFPGFDGGTGRAQLSLMPGWRLRYHLYGERYLQYSVFNTQAFYRGTRYGAAVDAAIPHRATVRVFYELGDNRYELLSGESGATEDYDGYGIDLQQPIGDHVGVLVGYSAGNFGRGFRGFSRSQIGLHFGVAVSFSRVRLQVGNQGGRVVVH